MNDVLFNPAELRETNLRGDEAIIDFGSGLGQFSRAIARGTARAAVFDVLTANMLGVVKTAGPSLLQLDLIDQKPTKTPSGITRPGPTAPTPQSGSPYAERKGFAPHKPGTACALFRSI